MIKSPVRYNNMEYVLMGFAVIVIIAALMYFRRLLLQSKVSSPKSKNASVFVNCPVCGTPLLPGENLYSKVFRPMNVCDQLCVIYGCPHCYPVCSSGIYRHCPVCRKTVPTDGYLISRLFNKTKSGKKHIIINGCKNCSRTKI